MTAITAPNMIVNPFATRFTRPGRLVPLDATGRPLDVGVVVESLRAAGGRAAIVGPHGTGKTTLLLALADRLAAAGRLAGVVRVRSWLDAAGLWRRIIVTRHGATLCVDGWEQLGPLAWITAALARGRGCGLVVTSHREPGLPILVRSEGSLPLLAALVASVPSHGDLIRDADVADAHRRHGGNLRESLYDLYDRFESRCR